MIREGRGVRDVVLRVVACLYFSVAAINLYRGAWEDWHWLGWILMGLGVYLFTQVPPADSFKHRIRLPLGIAAYACLVSGLLVMTFLTLRD